MVIPLSLTLLYPQPCGSYGIGSGGLSMNIVREIWKRLLTFPSLCICKLRVNEMRSQGDQLSSILEVRDALRRVKEITGLSGLVAILAEIQATHRDIVLTRNLAVSTSSAIATLRSELAALKEQLMTTMQELQAKATATLAQVTSDTDIDNAVAKVVNDQRQNIIDLKAQLDAAIAASDPAAIQAVSDTMDQILSLDTSNAAIVSGAVTSGTPVAKPA